MKRIRGVLCGDVSVGKSALLRRFSNQPFQENATQTIAGAFFQKVVKVGGEEVNLEIWDTAGSERYKSVIPSFFRGAGAIAIIYDITNKVTFDNLQYWMEFSQMNAPPGIPIFLVGNKIDLHSARVVSFEDGRKFAQQNGITDFLETSAKTGESVDGLFSLFSHIDSALPETIVPAEAEKKSNKKYCC